MTSANRTRLTYVREVTRGVTPASPNMRKMRMTGEGLLARPDFVQSAEIRDDRMMSDPARVYKETGGTIGFEFSYPVADSPLAEAIANAFQNDWTGLPARDNAGVADSVITNVLASTDTYTVTTGAAFVAGQVILASGFTNSANNGVFVAQAGTTATAVVAPAAPGLVDEAVPPGTARLKAVGVQGEAGDIVATASGLTSTTLNFTTLGLSVGQFVKIGGAAAGTQFATAANNGFARVTSIAANALGLDELPTGWGADTGATKTIQILVPDFIKNGVTMLTATIERGFMAHVPPTYLVGVGMHVDQMKLNMGLKDIIKGEFSFRGLSSPLPSTTSLDDTPMDETTDPVMTANVDVTRVTLDGATAVGPNWLQSVELTLNNNLRAIDAIGSDTAVDIAAGECAVSLKTEVIFGDKTSVDAFLAGTPLRASFAMKKAGRGVIIHFPRMIRMNGGNPNATAKNTDVKMSMEAMASKDAATSAHIIMCRFEYLP